ncbi:MAG: hypothetical protein ABW067_11170 [Rhizobacter sp.]
MHCIRLSLLLLAGVLNAAPAHAVDYRLQDISGGGRFQTATAINNLGQVTGGSASEGFFYSAGTGLLRMDDRPPTGFPAGAPLNAWGVDINDAGQVVGRWQGGGTARGFLYTVADGMRDLGEAGRLPSDISERGLVVGLAAPGPGGHSRSFYGNLEFGFEEYGTGAQIVSVVGSVDFGALVIVNREAPELGEQRTRAGWMFEGGADLPLPPGTPGTYALDNALDSTVVGYLQVSDDIHRAFVYRQAGGLLDFDTVLPRAARTSFATGVNERGQVIGGGEWADGSAFNFLYDLGSGSFVDLASVLDPLTSVGWSALQLNELNDLGQIVGTGLFQGESRAFLLSPMAPVPEPGPLAMLLLGALALGVTFRGRHARSGPLRGVPSPGPDGPPPG